MESSARTGLVDLVGEIERRLTTGGPSRIELPDASSYVLVLFDGLGDHQLDHPAARALVSSRVGSIAAPFPTTTTVAMATLATGLDPRTHGVLGHLVWLDDIGRVVNALKWVTPGGERVDYRTEALLPSPNLWERLETAGVEPITVQPGDFASTPLTRALYRGCRFESVWSIAETVDATATLARVPGRLVFTYLPQVDYAAHVGGQRSQAYHEAMSLVADVWSQLRIRLPRGAALVGVSDHGHIDYGPERKLLIRDPEYRSLTVFGDPRAVMVRGDPAVIHQLAGETGAELLTGDLRHLWGSGPDHPRLEERMPDAVLLAPPSRVLLLPSFDKRLVGYHGGLAPEEVEVPLLVEA